MNRSPLVFGRLGQGKWQQEECETCSEQEDTQSCQSISAASRSSLDVALTVKLDDVEPHALQQCPSAIRLGQEAALLSLLLVPEECAE